MLAVHPMLASEGQAPAPAAAAAAGRAQPELDIPPAPLVSLANPEC